ncbi:MAG: hypothetical protein ACI89U_000328 [Gammaproteobacteria bacterium]|jgi:hypothetical protein
MNLERLREIIGSYGASEEKWPSDERNAVLSFLDNSAEARALVNIEASLDTLLDAFEVPSDIHAQNNLKQKILAEIAPNFVERMIDWLTPELESLRTSFWRPTLAAALPLVVGIAIGVNFADDTSTFEDFTESEAFYLLAITGDSNGGWYEE